MSLNKNKKKSLKVVGYGAAGNVAGSLAGAALAKKKGYPVRKSMERGARVGTAAGLAVGGWRQSRHSTPSVTPTVGEKAFKRRVGTKTNARVGNKDHPFMVGGRG